MLVLNRKPGESITIDGQIKIKILCGYGSTRIGIDAPKHIRIVRDELIESNQPKTNQRPHHENTRP